jgi:hypothetical protein
MIALALFFVAIIGLLLVIILLLKKYFGAYSNLDENGAASELEKHIKVQEDNAPYQQINSYITKRLTELEQQIPVSQTGKEESEMLMNAFKKMLHSSMNLLKKTGLLFLFVLLFHHATEQNRTAKADSLKNSGCPQFNSYF